MNQATKAYLTKLGNPYAKLSVIGAAEDLPIWSKPADFLSFLGECFSTAQFGHKSPADFKQLAVSASGLSYNGQRVAKSRLMSLVPTVPLAFNRLGPENLRSLAAKIRIILEEAMTLDETAE